MRPPRPGSWGNIGKNPGFALSYIQMKASLYFAGSLALALWLSPGDLSAQNVGYSGLQSVNGANTGVNGNGVGTIPRVMVAPNYQLGRGGIRYVTVQAPVVFQQQAARQFFIAGGVRLNGQSPYVRNNQYPRQYGPVGR